MKKVRLEIVGLSYSQTQSGAYALVLGETAGSRRLPIIIGGFEAQAIAIELEKMSPSRPLTHDLFKTFAQTFDINVTEVLIYNLVEGIFYAKLLCNDGTKEVEIDARTSDAIAIAVRFKCPISTYEFILKSAGIVLDDEPTAESSEEAEKIVELSETPVASKTDDYKEKSTEELKNLLQTALDEEQYELASKIRDELNQRKKS
ncbi:MAG: bifunctional nuclease family protein [Bacteroidota bacterium]|nr:bifunctional nuclease family protein [Bacteroidota bacterium]MDP3145177.1 bifunctional nuclease family protein [Bacteroidota bacterium]MDP3557297.1 bifunctional nuclease family protein [Bacteroidota bacterium]